MLLASETDPAAMIRQGMMDRGMPPHVADAFIMNFRDESGLRTDINEVAPIVPGSRGGFGLAQWTGPRRRELEAFAAQRGVPVSDMNAQLDFLMSELQGSEARAAQAIFAAPDTATAADAILRQFLRPAPEHRERRSAAYLGGQAPQQPQGGQTMPQGLLSPTVSTMNTQGPQEPSIWDALVGRLPEGVQPIARRTIGDADWRDRMAIALAGMSTRPNQAIIGTLQDRMESRDQDRRANQTVAYLESIGRPDLAAAIAAGLPAGDAIGAALAPAPPPPAPIEVNGQLWDPVTRQVIADLRTAETPEPGYRTLTPEEAAAAGLPADGLWQEAPDGQFERVPGTEGAAPTDPTELRTEWNRLPQVQDFADRSAAFRNVVASAQNPSPAGDVSLIYNYMKMLDPGSAIQQGEIALAQDAGSLPNQLVAQYNAVINGQALAPDQRKDFLDRAAELYQTQEQGYLRIRSQYENTAREAGLDPDAALTDYRYFAEGQVPFVREAPAARPTTTAPAPAARPTAPAPAPAPAGNSPVTIPPSLLQNQSFVELAQRRNMTPEEYFQSLPPEKQQELLGVFQ